MNQIGQANKTNQRGAGSRIDDQRRESSPLGTHIGKALGDINFSNFEQNFTQTNKLSRATRARDSRRLFQNAMFKNSQLTKVGRALTRHPDILGYTKDNLRQAFRLDSEINAQGARILKEIMRYGKKSTSSHNRYGPITTYQLPNGKPARFYTETEEFIGFIKAE